MRRITAHTFAGDATVQVLDAAAWFRACDDEELIVLLRCDVPAGWFDRFFRYASQADDSARITFANTRFVADPPGLRVGPWPGWRGIPEMPLPVLSVGEHGVAGSPQFHGDERQCGIVRVAYRVGRAMGGEAVLDVRDSGVRLRDIDVLAGCMQAAVPVELPLRPELRGRHPRLLFAAGDVGLLRRKAGGLVDEDVHRPFAAGDVGLMDEDVHRPFAAGDVGLVDEDVHRPFVAGDVGLVDEGVHRPFAEGWELPFEVSAESKVLPGPERLAMEDRVLLSAFDALLHPDDEARRRRALDAFAEGCRVREHPGRAPLSIDTQSGEALFCLCLAYDWLHAVMDVPTRAQAREVLDAIAGVVRAHLHPARRDYAQAHWLGAALGLFAYTLVIDDDAARTWRAELHGAYRHIVAMLPADGFFPHGINLWIYEYGFHFRWLELLRHCCGVDLWHVTPHWREAARFRIASTSADLRHGITFGDPQFRVGGDSWLFDLVTRRTHDPHCATFADALREQPQEGVDFRHAPPRRRVYEALWSDTPAAGIHVSGIPASGIPASAHGAGTFGFHFVDGVHKFEDGGHICWRRGDLLVAFRSGAPVGRARRAAGEWGAYGHGDPCNGSFLVWWRDRFVVSGPGPVYRRDTSLQNLFTVDGRGQLGDSCVWLPDVFPDEAIPPPPVVASTGEGLTIEADLTRAFLPDLGVLRCTRRLVLSPDGSLTGQDAIDLREDASIDWRLHTRLPLDMGGGEEGSCAMLVDDDRCTLELAASAAVGHAAHTSVPARLRAEAERVVPAYPNDGIMSQSISCVLHARSVRIDWRLQLPADGREPR